MVTSPPAPANPPPDQQSHALPWVLREVVRLVLDDDWTACAAATTLRAQADTRVLQQARASVVRALGDRPSRVDERAALTLRLATADGPVACSLDGQGCPACGVTVSRA